ncbi:hypothetical protein SFRURICE_021286 [Spodoptera frugiperda]|nr:hypothetical protein SFRURICE_021286 [Spodoptera frugiperda]
MWPALVQHFVTPNLFRAAMKTWCRVLVRNSDIVIPVPFSLVLLCQTLSRVSTSCTLTSMGLGLDLPVIAVHHPVTTTDIGGTPWISNIFLRPLISSASISRAKNSICRCRHSKRIQSESLECPVVLCQS